eukprot:GHUV01039762.1.p1 GENE.GHUV01039762.1~~GHUV01039762.1.p1  ORF type:complete len:240 (+),score=87.34 GHUV01039762.1:23-721(+)
MAGAAAAGNSSAIHEPAIKVVGCERNPVLAAAAEQLVKHNHLRDGVTVIQKLSNQLTVHPDATKTSKTKSNNCKVTSDNRDNSYDLYRKASLVVHEIFGTDPLSEQVLPALRQVQLDLAASAAAAPAAGGRVGCRFLPRALRIVAAVAECSKLCQHLRISDQMHAAPGPAAVSDQQQQWDLSSLLLLLPRKCEMQCDEVAADLMLLTQPAAVLEFDFEQQWPLPLNGKVMGR